MLHGQDQLSQVIELGVLQVISRSPPLQFNRFGFFSELQGESVDPIVLFLQVPPDCGGEINAPYDPGACEQGNCQKKIIYRHPKSGAP